jgi:FixJ family two-component response regulator
MEPIKPLIAVVDDDPSILKALRRMLRSAGYDVGVFGSAQEFLRSLAFRSPQCLVLDVHLPGMTGIELHDRLRNLGCQLPIVFITANDTPQTRTAASHSEGTALLFKPFGNTALLAAICKGVARSRLDAAKPSTSGGMPAAPRQPLKDDPPRE